MHSEQIPNDEDEQNNTTENFSLSYQKNNKKQKILYIFIVVLIILGLSGVCTYIVIRNERNKYTDSSDQRGIQTTQQPKRRIQTTQVQSGQKGQQTGQNSVKKQTTQQGQQVDKQSVKKQQQKQVDKKSFKRVYGPLHYRDKNSSPDHQTSPTTKILQQKYKKQTGTQLGTLKQQSRKKPIEKPTNTTDL